MDAVLASLVLAWDELGVDLEEAADLAEVFVIELFFVYYLASEDDLRIWFGVVGRAEAVFEAAHD